jgi:predicted MFS family arabinose efflux permease
MRAETAELLQDQRYRRLFSSRFISNVGNGMQPIALAFGVLALPGATPSSLSLVLAAQAVAVLLVLPFGGAIADRYGAARIVGGTDILISIVVLMQAALFLTANATVPLLTVLAVMAGALNGMWYPAFVGLTPDVVPERSLQPANAWLSVAHNVGYILGASLGGLIVASAGPAAALAVDAASFLIAGMLVWSFRRVSHTRHSGESMVRDIIEGWGVFISYRWVVVISVSYSFIVMCWHASEAVLGPVLANEVYGGPRGWSVVLAAQACGLLAGGLIAVKVKPRRPLIVGSLVTLTLPAWELMFAGELPLVAVALGAMAVGIAIEYFYVVWMTAFQANIPRESLSRVGSYDAFGALMLGPLGIALAGPLIGLVGLSVVFVAAAAISFVAIVGMLASSSVRGLRMNAAADGATGADPA